MGQGKRVDGQPTRIRRTELTGVKQRDRPKERTLLWDWVEKNQVTNYKLSRLTRIDSTHVKAIMEGRAVPSLLHAHRIELATSGYVPMESWLDTRLAKLYLQHDDFRWQRWIELMKAKVCRWAKSDKPSAVAWRARQAQYKKEKYEERKRAKLLPDGTPTAAPDDGGPVHEEQVCGGCAPGDYCPCESGSADSE